MNLRALGGFFSTKKSLNELLVDTFNYLYERSPLTLGFLTGYYHPRIPRLTGNIWVGRSTQAAKDAFGLTKLFEELATLAVDDIKNPRGMAYCSLAIAPCLLITRPTDIAQLLQYNGDKVVRGIPAFKEIFGHGNLISAEVSDEWREKRNKLRRWIFASEALTELAPQMQTIIDEFVVQLKQDGNIQSLESFLVSLTMNVFAQTRLGASPLGDSVHSISDGLGKALDGASGPLNNVIAKLASTIEYYTNIKISTRIAVEKAKLQGILEEHFFKPQEKNLKTAEGLLKSYFDKYPADTKSAFDEAYDDAAIYLLAGQETTERLLQFSFLVLKRHPEVLAKVREEIEAYKPTDGKWTRSILDEMHYLGKFLKEVLRLYPPAPIIPRIVTTTLTLADIPLCTSKAEYDAAMANRDSSKDVILPPGTSVNIMPLVTHKIASLYPNPLEFKPERHANDSVAADKSFAYLPFGVGHRDCPGRKFALQEAKIALIAFLQNFNFETSLDGKEFETYVRGTLKLKEEVQVKFTHRF